MSVRVEGTVIRLCGVCPVEDAEPLMIALLDFPARTVDLSEAQRLHMSVVQILAAADCALSGELPPGFLRDVLVPGLLKTDRSKKDTGSVARDL